MRSIDLNADLGEDVRPGADDEVIPLVSSANLACGGHAGDPATMMRAAALAVRHGVAIGAHPGYPDRPGFGRHEIDATPGQITAWVARQVAALVAACRPAGGRPSYVKPHGALYNRAAVDPAAAAAVVEGVRRVDPELAVLGLAGSHLLDAARAADLHAVAEAFADRRYLHDGTLVPRSRPDAVIEDDDEAVAQALAIALHGRVRAVDGTTIRVAADSLCVHGDDPRAAARLRLVRERLHAAGVEIRPFAAAPAVPRPPSRRPRTPPASARHAPLPGGRSARIACLGDSALTVTLADEIDLATNRLVHQLARRLRHAAIPGVTDVVPAYVALTLFYDPLHLDARALADRVRDVLAAPDAGYAADTATEHLVPCVYDGPDLEEVARRTGLDAGAVVALHSGRPYTVHLLGFVPGFAYLGDLDDRLALERRAEPRARVPAGSVAIAGRQTAVYPLDTPGGWHLIGRARLGPFDPSADPPTPFRPGDQVRFVPVASLDDPATGPDAPRGAAGPVAGAAR